MRRRWVVVTLASVAGAAGALVALILGFLTVWHCSSGDGGYPYVAPDSPQAGVCDATGDGLLLMLLAVAAAGAAAVAAYFAGRAWIEARGSAFGFGALVVAAALAPLGVIWVGNLPSDQCSAEEEAANPEDCVTY